MKPWLFVLATTLAAAGCNSQPAPANKDAQAANATVVTLTSRSPEAVAHFQRGEMLLDNLRQEEAAAAFSEALKLDPNFALARAYHAVATPGPAGLKELESAAGGNRASSCRARADRWRVGNPTERLRRREGSFYTRHRTGAKGLPRILRAGPRATFLGSEVRRGRPGVEAGHGAQRQGRRRAEPSGLCRTA